MTAGDGNPPQLVGQKFHFSERNRKELERLCPEFDIGAAERTIGWHINAAKTQHVDIFGEMKRRMQTISAAAETLLRELGSAQTVQAAWPSMADLLRSPYSKQYVRRVAGDCAGPQRSAAITQFNKSLDDVIASLIEVPPPFNQSHVGRRTSMRTDLVDVIVAIALDAHVELQARAQGILAKIVTICLEAADWAPADIRTELVRAIRRLENRNSSPIN